MCARWPNNVIRGETEMDFIRCRVEDYPPESHALTTDTIERMASSRRYLVLEEYVAPAGVVVRRHIHNDLRRHGVEPVVEGHRLASEDLGVRPTVEKVIGVKDGVGIHIRGLYRYDEVFRVERLPGVVRQSHSELEVEREPNATRGSVRGGESGRLGNRHLQPVRPCTRLTELGHCDRRRRSVVLWCRRVRWRRRCGPRCHGPIVVAAPKHEDPGDDDPDDGHGAECGPEPPLRPLRRGR